MAAAERAACSAALELRIPPVAQVVILAAAMWALARAVPALTLPLPGAHMLAWGFTGAGATIALLGVFEFRRARTTVDPRCPDKAERMVTGGVYGMSRNPMYLGFLLVLLGWACYLGNGLAFLLLPVFVAYMNRFQIQPEERCMHQNFGEEFGAYAARVRRWI